MTSPNDQHPVAHLVKQGGAALKTGDRATARRLLVQAVEQQPEYELAWLWLAGAVSDPIERQSCLERVLALNPHNAMAKQGLTQILQTTEQMPLPSQAPPLENAPTATPPLEQIHPNGAGAHQRATVETVPPATMARPHLVETPKDPHLRPVQLGALESVIPERDDHAIKILTAMLAFILFIVLVGILYLRSGNVPTPPSRASEHLLFLTSVASNYMVAM